MKVQKLLIALTIVNCALLLFLLAQTWPAVAQGTAPVLRGRALEIVDDHGRKRATISVIPVDASVRMPDGSPYPETVLLRLIDPNGRPNVKLQATEQGAGLGLGGADDPTYVALGAQGASVSLKLTDKSGKELVVKP